MGAVPQAVLMFSYYYPPLGGIGSQRSQKFARYLPDNGWAPIVITPKHGAYHLDPTLDDGSSRGVEVVRTATMDLSASFKRWLRGAKAPAGAAAGADLTPLQGGAFVRSLQRIVRTCVYVPDGQIGWLPYAVRAGREVLRRRPVRAIYSTSFPVTAHVAACRLKRATSIPWVADFRDLWTENHYRKSDSRLRGSVDRLIERKLLDAADVLVTVSDAWAETLRRLTGGTKRVEVVRNGFDPTDFEGIERRRPDRWTITYVGDFYGAKSDPKAFLAALSRLLSSGRIPREDVRFRIVGARDEFVAAELARFGLTDVTEWSGFVSHRDCIRSQVDTSLLLLILHREHANTGVLPGKLYEYLGARRPVLAIVPPEFEAAKMLRGAGAGDVAEAGDEAAIERVLLASYARFRSGEEPETDPSDLSPYERQGGARQLAQILSEVSGGVEASAQGGQRP